MANTQRKVSVSLEFSANTQKIKAQLNDLQKQLQGITNMPVTTNMTAHMKDQLHEASLAAADLQMHLKKATNVETGNIDFNKLNQSLKKSGTTLIDYGKKLQQIGPEGQKAFVQLAMSVANAEVPLRRSSKLLDEFWKNLKRTAQYEISSKILRGAESALSSAYRYAQDLNESLNDIRIVTGYNTEQMAKFAQEANKAAKSLSTTTTEYTKASLIYYQQGLSDKEVKERADITVKMANASGASAEKVSSQLTAVWNNFNDGTKALEYYADVMTALGAATASSTDEISNGLNKFASVAETVGLSYEYAASALATVTSTTRESADVVGTAFKTLFARIQDLELGKTLDDGTTMGQYSEALAKVGIDIKEANGNIKSMDTLLTEMAGKWNTINKDSQIALAQNVAGVRQYTQLVALLDNWDFFQSNLETSLNSTGELDKQAKIYAESWEAAENRVKASLETIYEKILDDEAFIKMLNIFADFIDGIDYMVDRVGGLEGVLASLGAVLTRVFSKQLSQSINDMVYGLKMMTVRGQKAVKDQKLDTMEQFVKNFKINNSEEAQGQIKGTDETNKTKGRISGFEESIIGKGTQTESITQKIYSQQLKAQKFLMENAENLTEEEQKKLEILREQYKAYSDVALKNAEILDKKTQETLELDFQAGTLIDAETDEVEKEKVKTNITTIREEASKQAILRDFSSFTGEVENDEKLKELTEKAKIKYSKTFGETITKDIFNEEFEKDLTKDNLTKKILGLLEDSEDSFNNAQTSLDKKGEKYKALSSQIATNAEQVSKAMIQQANSLEQLDTSMQDNVNSMNAQISETRSWSEILVEGTNAIFNLSLALSALNRLDDTWQNPNISNWEKLKQTFFSLITVLPALTSGIKGLQIVFSKETLEKVKNTLANIANAKTEKDLADAKKETADAADKNAEEIKEETRRKVVERQSEKINWDGLDYTDLEIDGQKYRRKNLGKNPTGAIDHKFFKLDANGNETEIGINDIIGNTSLKGKKSVNQAFDKNPLQTSAPLIKETVEMEDWTDIGDLQLPNGKPNKIKTGISNIGTKAKTFVGAHGAAIGAIGTAAVIIAGAAIAFKALDKAWNKDAIAAKNAAKAAEQAAENYNSAKTEYENLQQTIESYSSAKNNLDGLVEGTLEFKEALIAANDEAYKLIEQYDDLQYTIDSNGLININADSLQAAKEKEFEQMNQARTASLVANQNAKNKQLEADITEFNRSTAKDQDIGSGDSWNTTGKGTAIGAGIGAALGATLAIALAPFTGGLSLAAGLGIGALAAGAGALGGASIGTGIGGGLSIGKSQTEDEKNLIKKMGELYKDQGSAVFDKEYLLKVLKDEENFGEGWIASNEKLIDSLFTDENIEATKKLTKEIAANTAANEAQNKLLTQQDLANNKAVQNSQYSDQITTIVNSQRDAEIRKMTTGEGKLAGWGKDNISQISTEKDKDAQKVWKEYLESMGIDSKDMENYKLEGVIGNDNNRAFTYRKKKEDGTWDEELTTVDLDDMVEQRAQFLVKDKLNTIGSDYAKKFKGQNEATVGLAQAIIANDYSKMTLGSLDGTVDDTTKEFLKDELNLSDEEIKNTLDKAEEAWKAKLDNFTFKGKEAVKNLSENYSNLSKESAEAYGTMIDTVFKRGGSTAVDGMKNIISKLLDATNGNLEKQQALLMRMANISWEDGASGLNELELILQDLNIEIPEGIENLKGFKTVLEDIDFASVTFDLNALRKELTALNELLPKVKIGEVITDEEYKTLLKYNAGLKDFFVMTASGYSYIGGAGDIEQDIKGAEVEKIKKSYDANRAAYNSIKKRATTEGSVDYNTLTENASADELINLASYIADSDTEEDVAILKATDVDRAWLQNQIDKLYADSNDETARAELEKFFSDVATIQNQGNLGAYDNALGGEEMAVFETVETVEELINLLSKGEISYATYEKMLPLIQERSEKLTDAWEENLRKIKDSVSATHDLDKAIELIDIRLKKLNTDTEDLFGEDFIKNYGEGLKLGAEKVVKLIDKRSGLNNDVTEAFNNLVYEANMKDYKLEFDNEGNLINGGKEALEKARDNYWNAVNATGPKVTPEEQRDIDAKKKAFDDIQNLISAYDKSREAVLNNEQAILDAWVSVKEKLYNAYTEAIEQQGKAISEYTDRIDHSISTLNNFKSILELTGKSSSEQMRLVLKTTADTTKALMDTSKAEYETKLNNVENFKEQMAEYLAAGGKETGEIYQTLEKNYKSAVKVAEESQNEMFENTKAWGEAMKAQIEHDMNEASKALEKVFTGGKTFDELTTSMERSSLLQEEYLTSTNKIYEISKLTRNVQANIDKTTNSVAKRKLKAFMDETKQLQDQEKLSKFELELQQKKYDLLVAEIALQDAQEAKSTVRLTRTADGGFGYVYTADENKVAEAQQKYEDAENALYNTRLEGANNYAEKSIQAQQEFLQSLQELNTQYLNGEITSEEEYQRKREELVNYFNEQLATYNSSYNLAISEDVAIARDAWSTEFSNMIIDSGSWKDAITGHLTIIDEEFKKWGDVVEEVETTVGSDLENLNTKTGAIATSTDEAVTALIGEDGKGGLVGALSNTASEISNYIKTTLAPWLAELEKIKKTQGEVNGGLPTGEGATGGLNPWQKVSAAFQKGDMASATAVINDMTDISDEHKQNLISGLSWGRTGSGHSNQSDIAMTFSSGEKITEETAANWAKNAPKKPSASDSEETEFSWDNWKKGNYKEAKQFLQDSGKYSEAEIDKIMSGKGYYDTEDNYNNVKSYYNSLGQDGMFQDNRFKEAVKKDLLLRIANALNNEENIESILEDDEFGVLDSKEAKALMALSSQVKIDKAKADNIISKIGEGTLDIEAIKNILTFDVAKNYMNDTDKITVPYYDFNLLDFGAGGGGYQLKSGDKTYQIKELKNDETVEYYKNLEERQAYFDDGSITLRRYRITQDQIANAISAFDTGGYTGSWGPEGKMAMLHQKEIVLNETDTANFLESIKLLRSILSFIDLQATNAQFSSLSSNAHFTPSTSEVLEQNVHIDAHFDNVTDRNEIVEAFNTLVNRASQYANRKK